MALHRENEQRNILITGATGFLGKHFAQELLSNTNSHIYAYVRKSRSGDVYDREEIMDLLNNRFHIIEADISQERFYETSEKLPKINEIWHIAGSTDFTEQRRIQIENINIKGTSNIVQLAQRLSVDRFFHISTAYVSGITDITVEEDALLPNPVFRNVYEETKYRGEQIVRKSNLPFYILRPSIIMGHSLSGDVQSDKMVYGVLKLYHRVMKLLNKEYWDGGGIPENLLYYVKGIKGVKKNLICVDDVVNLMLKIRRNGETFKTYHLCNPEYTTISELHECIINTLGVQFLKVSPTIPGSKIDKYQKLINRGVGVYENYMVYSDPEFDLTNTNSIQEVCSIKCLDTPLQSYLYKNYLDNRLSKEKKKVKKELDLDRIEDIRAFGNNTLSFSTLYSQYSAFNVSGIKGFLPYVVTEETAVMVGDPITNEYRTLISAFIKKCFKDQLNPAAIQIGEKSAGFFKEQGFSINTIGIETYLDLSKFDLELKGKAYTKIRRWRNSNINGNIVVKEAMLSNVPAQQVQYISDQWIKNKKNKSELGILLRELSLTPEPYVRRFFAFLNGEIVGYIFFDPIFRNKTIVGYYVNIERYYSRAKSGPQKVPNGLIPYIILNAIEKFLREGIEFVSLGLSPLYRINTGQFNDNSDLMELFEHFFQQSELYSFKGIANHKRRYPERIESPVYFASQKGNSLEDIFNIFDSIGILNTE